VGLIDDVGGGPTGLDTAIFIYFIEEHPTFLPVVEPLFVAADRGQLELVTSTLTLLETLVVPYRGGDMALADRYEALLTRSRGVRLVEIDRPLLRRTAYLRARTRVRTPDGLQLAAALATRCTTYVTNDRDVPAVSGLRILQVRDYRR
jgi:predicted nucleic acid-binding protein